MEVRSAVELVSPLGKQACAIANQRVVASLTEFISRAALKCQRNRLATARGRVVLIAQRNQIEWHGLDATYLRGATSLPKRNDSVPVSRR